LLDRAIGFAGGDRARVIVLSIPDWGVTPFARVNGRDPKQVAGEIDAYNAAAREVSAERGVAFFDVTETSRRSSSEPLLLAEDGLHPSAAMYRLWVELIAPHVIEVVSRR
jgi:lysophospholipase L1-like esterase